MMNSQSGMKHASIVVEKDVVKHLSLGLYRNFALAIKELISNAYDAGATEVKLKLDLKNRRIILRDNGQGMNENEFKEEYLHIGFYKEPSNKIDDLGRMRIGTFGIGFLAPLPYCKTLKIITKKRGQKNTIEGEIQAENFFTTGNWDIKDEKVGYQIKESDLLIDEGETIIILEDIKNQIYDELRRETKLRRTIEGSGYEKFKWTLAQYCPIEFPPEREDLRSFFNPNNRVPMELWLDGIQIYRNVPEKSHILERESKNFGNIDLRYVVMTPFEPVKPEEMRGLQIRLKDVAIGFPRDFDVTKLGRVLGKLNHLAGEVHILAGLDNSLLVNRDSFNYTEDVADMYDFFRGRLTYWNEKLYKWAEKDKELYLALGDLRQDERLIEKLTESNLIHFSTKRVRLSEGTLRKSKSTTVEDPVDKVITALSNKVDNSQIIVRKKGKVDAKTPAIQIEDEAITIYEDHPAFSETLDFKGEMFDVKYDDWNYQTTPYSICRITSDKKTVIFNKAHPLFKGKLNDKIVKSLGLGILLTLNNVQDKEILIEKLNRLLEDTFSD